jgi:hypothetical protein
VLFGRYELVVEEMDEMRVARVRFTRLPDNHPAPGSDAAGDAT